MDDDCPVVNQRRRPNPTVAPCDLKLRFWLFAVMSRFFGKLVWYCLNRVNVFAIHRCINEGYGLIRIFTGKYGFPPRNCGVSGYMFNEASGIYGGGGGGHIVVESKRKARYFTQMS